MTALDLTADAEEYRETARELCGEGATVRTLMYLYGHEGQVHPGLSQQVREVLHRTEREAPIHGPIVFSRAYRLGKLLGHVSTLEDRLNEDRACEKSPTGWHEWANNERCCHCGKDVP